MKTCIIAIRRVNTMAIPTTNSALIFGPPLSVSKKRIMPIEELGPDCAFFIVLNFIIPHLKDFRGKRFIYNIYKPKH